MQFSHLAEQAIHIQNNYRELNRRSGLQAWTTAEYMQGFLGDVGDLAKLIMAKHQYRKIKDYDDKLAHELSDCLWSLLVLSHELNIDLEQEFLKTMIELKQKTGATS